MNMEEIKDLMKSMQEHGMTRVAIRHQDFECELERGRNSQDAFYAPAAPIPMEHPVSMAPPLHPLHLPVSSVPHADLVDLSCDYITSPVVGTFYVAPSPTDPVFVKVGDRIDKGAVVAIVEAMKVMNEVRSQLSGVVEEILVKNGHPVEFGTKLIRIKTS